MSKHASASLVLAWVARSVTAEQAACECVHLEDRSRWRLQFLSNARHPFRSWTPLCASKGSHTSLVREKKKTPLLAPRRGARGAARRHHDSAVPSRPMPARSACVKKGQSQQKIRLSIRSELFKYLHVREWRGPSLNTRADRAAPLLDEPTAARVGGQVRVVLDCSSPLRTFCITWSSNVHRISCSNFNG